MSGNDQLSRRELLKTIASGTVVWGIIPDTHAASLPDKSSLGQAINSTVSPDVQSPWYRQLLVGIEVGPTGANDKDKIYMARASGKEIIENIVKSKSEYLVIFMKDQDFAYYNSKAARKCPNLGHRDLLRECLDEAKKYALPVVAYCQIQYDTATWKEHPEWRMKDKDGKDINSRLCYNSGYLEFIKQVAAEMMEYEIKGFHFDMLDYGFGTPIGCWCEYCQSGFKKEYGIAMPADVTWDEAWDKMLEFRCNSNTRFCKELQAFVRSKRPDISVDYNYHGYPPFSWYPGERPVQHAMNGDFVTAEGLPWIFGHNNPSLLALFMAGARPGGPIQGVTSRSIYVYHDFTVRPAAEMTWETMTYLSHGAQCTIVDKANYDGSLDPVVFERIGEAFAEARRKRDYFGHKPVQEVGLYYSNRSRDWYGREDSPKYMNAFWGAHKALMQSHITMGMVMDENVSPERLKEFPVVYIPNAPVLTEKEVSLFEDYVSEGGNLLMTGLTGLCDRYGKLQNRSLLSKLVGARLVRSYMEFPDNYIRLSRSLNEGEGKYLLNDIPPDWPMLTYGPLAAFEPDEAQVFGELMIAHRSKENQWSRHMSPDRVVGPAVLI
ncbi:MAG: beta-galactosidase trimerization domain-containing protein, partial [Patescibacteria group bacterium]|nr:beta-galactosidase trimerization domain-containing protein [Patescibacteria group bacterium]